MKHVLCLIIFLILLGIPASAQVTEDDNREERPVSLSLQDLQENSNYDIFEEISSELKDNKMQDSIGSYVTKKRDIGSIYPVYIDKIPFDVIFSLSKGNIINNAFLMLISDSLGPYESLAKYKILTEETLSLGNIKSYTNADNRRALFCFPFSFNQGRVISIYIDSKLHIVIDVDSPNTSQKEKYMYNYIENNQLDGTPIVRKKVINFNNFFKNRVRDFLN